MPEMKKFIAGIAGYILTITISKELLGWLGSAHGIYPDRWVAGLFGPAANSASAHSSISNILLGFVAIAFLVVGLLVYIFSKKIFGRKAVAVQNSGRNARPAQKPAASVAVNQLRIKQLKLKHLRLKQLRIIKFRMHQLRSLQSRTIQTLKRQLRRKQLTKKQLPKKRLPKKQLNDWRADANVIKTLRSNDTDRKNVNIVYYDNRNLLFTKRLA